MWEITKYGTLPQLKKPVFIEGLPGIGNVGKVAVDFMVDELNAKKLYSFYSVKFPHTVFVNEDNLVELPNIEMYYKKSAGNKKQDFLFLVGDIQPIDEESCHRFCMDIIRLLKRFKCTEIITTGGIGLQHVPEKPRLFCTGNDAAAVEKYVATGSGVRKDIYGVVGPIMGVSGLLVGLAKKENLSGVSLLAETLAHPLYVGVKGAKELIKVIDRRFSLGLNIKRLSDEITKVEEEVLKRGDVSKMAGTTAREPTSYIG
jgi:hypothetical protein